MLLLLLQEMWSYIPSARDNLPPVQQKRPPSGASGKGGKPAKMKKKDEPKKTRVSKDVGGCGMHTHAATALYPLSTAHAATALQLRAQ